jgi:hypothetical protein
MPSIKLHQVSLLVISLRLKLVIRREPVPDKLIAALFDAKTVSIHSRFGLDADDAFR